MWIRNTAANHGNVFLNCKFQTLNNGTTEFARAPTNGGRGYPNAEVVLLNCALGGISPAGWGNVGGDTSNVHFWEFNSVSASDGKPVDVSQRAAWSKQLDKEKDAETIRNYSNPAYVLGWTPKMAPIILRQPQAVTVSSGSAASLTVQVAAISGASYQWFKNNSAIGRATDAVLKLENVKATDAGNYTVIITNDSGAVTSAAAILTVK
jgi:hypothetical protein